MEYQWSDDPIEAREGPCSIPCPAFGCEEQVRGEDFLSMIKALEDHLNLRHNNEGKGKWIPMEGGEDGRV